MIINSKFFIIIGLASCCSKCPASDLPCEGKERYELKLVSVFQGQNINTIMFWKSIQNILRYTCARGLCLDDVSDQPNGNQICSINYGSLESAQNYCYLYKCDKIIQYDFNGSGKTLYLHGYSLESKSLWFVNNYFLILCTNIIHKYSISDRQLNF